MRLISCAILSLACATTFAQGPAQPRERPLGPSITGDLAAGPQTLTVRATAGLVVFGSIEVKDTTGWTPVPITFHAADGSKLQEVIGGDYGKLNMGFVAPKDGLYSIRI